VADRLRSFGAPSTAIWTEDWKGGKDNPATGYHLTGEWTVDEGLYPNASEMAEDLEDRGFKWLAYFSPFVFEETTVWEDAVEKDVLVKDSDGAPYLFQSALLGTKSGWVDLSTQHGRDWVAGYLQGAIDLGFDGWMADFAEWLPPDAVLASGESALEAHNAYPEWWQETHSEAIGEQDAAFFVRSGWLRTGGLVPAVWAGDQRTSFDTDDGFPTVVSMGLGLAASGIPIFTHDVAGYQSVGNEPTDKELWFRWASLGAYSPISRTHHGAYDEDNWQFDSDDETTEHQVRVASEHMRLWPYRYGLAARAADEGIPVIQPVSFVVGNEDWGRQDAWMLGDALLVAPVLEAGVTRLEVDLPATEDWWDWRTLEPAISGPTDAPLEEIPVFARGGTLVPTFAEIPDTLVPTDNPDVVTLEDVDNQRVVYVFGSGGPFVEADGTRYRPSGEATGSGEITHTLDSGTLEVAGVTVQVTGSRERTYTLVVVAD
jgi:alpha-glucosidase (family GH31 glycosyl hydrolase)